MCNETLRMPAMLLRKETPALVFSYEFFKHFKTIYLQDTSERLPLKFHFEKIFQNSIFANVSGRIRESLFENVYEAT